MSATHESERKSKDTHRAALCVFLRSISDNDILLCCLSMNAYEFSTYTHSMATLLGT